MQFTINPRLEVKSNLILLIQLFLVIVLSGVLKAQIPELGLLVRFDDPGPMTMVGASAQRLIVPALNIYLLEFNDEAGLDKAYQKLSFTRGVSAVERNRMVEFRTDPDDDLYESDQQNLRRAGFDRAWDLTPGGKTTEGEDIVVAILDAGFDVSHEDLAPNLWRNLGEVANDGIDNDNNGYVDDIHGWDMIGDDNSLPNDTHGTSVIGILGAKGNNGRGVSGTNWDLKMMLFSINTIADIVEAYGYVLAQRKLYNSTNGSQGAFIVATNASFGIENSRCEQFPVWSSLYEELGQEGVLTAASTANRSLDVNTFGDMPADCDTEFLIGVANLDTNDRLWMNSGYSREKVDLAAPGQESYTTMPGGRYGTFGSTSAAAPYVTGAIALLYATPCPVLQDLIRNNPADAARLIKATILSSTTPNPSLEFRTSSGGSLDVAEAQRLLIGSCDLGNLEEFSITGIFPNPAATTAFVQTNALVFSDGAKVELYDAFGRLVRTQLARRLSGSPVRLAVNVSGLPAGWYSLRVEERERVALGRIVVY